MCMSFSRKFLEANTKSYFIMKLGLVTSHKSYKSFTQITIIYFRNKKGFLIGHVPERKGSFISLYATYTCEGSKHLNIQTCPMFYSFKFHENPLMYCANYIKKFITWICVLIRIHQKYFYMQFWIVDFRKSSKLQTQTCLFYFYL